MSQILLTNEEFSARLHELRAQLEFVKGEADRRGKLCLATDLAAAQESVGSALRAWTRSNLVLEPWQFIGTNGKVYCCSWCEREQGHQPEAGDHGACPRHRQEWISQLQARRAA